MPAPPPVPTKRMPRLWPLYVVLVIQAAALVVSVTPQIDNYTRFFFMVLGPAAAALLGLVWLLLMSRLRWSERVALVTGAMGLGIAASLLVHESMPTTLWLYGIPMALLLMAIGLRMARSQRPLVRTGVSLMLVAGGFALFTLGRLTGFDGSYLPELQWRWLPTSEDRLVTRAGSVPVETAAPLRLAPGDWPGFRGPHRNSRVAGVRVRSDWDVAAPRELWRIPVGPGWSSFAHVDGRLFTQEQHGENEAVVCYDAATGREIWLHAYPTRFTETVSGPGPRATPTFADGRLYTFGAKATLICLDAAGGSAIWQRNLMAEIDATLSPWAFTSSPLVTDGVVIVYADGRDDHGLVAYDATTGDPAWRVATGGMNYASAQLVTIDDTDLVLFTGDSGLLAMEPATGTVQWRFTPDGWKPAPMVQPQLIDADSLIVPLGDGVGVARIDVTRDGDTWNVTQRWSSRRLKPSFNDFVYHDGALYGFDQSIVTCIDAETGARRWRGGRYGFGQILLLEETKALLVVSESGDIILLAADPNERRELGRIAALDGKTWNHPVVVGDQLFVRNGEEAVCYELAVE